MPCEDKCEKFEYALQGPQVEPSAGYWQYCARLCIVGIDALRALTDKKNDPHYFPPYPTDEKTLQEEIDELVDLAQHRDDPCHLIDPKKCDEAPAVCEFHKGLPKARCRRSIMVLRWASSVPRMSRANRSALYSRRRGLECRVRGYLPGK